MENQTIYSLKSWNEVALENHTVPFSSKSLLVSQYRWFQKSFNGIWKTSKAHFGKTINKLKRSQPL